MQGSAPLGDCWTPPSGCVHGSGRPGNRVGHEDETCARPSGRLGFRGPGVACAGPRKENEETRTWKRTFGVPGRTACAKSGEWRLLWGGGGWGGWTGETLADWGNKIPVAPEGAKKLELMRGAEPRLSRTREWIWERGVKDRGFRDPTAWGARSGSVCSFPFIWPQGGARAGGGRTGAGQPQPSSPRGGGRGTG